MHSPGINGEGELWGQPANPGSPGKMAVKNGVCVCVCLLTHLLMFTYCCLLYNTKVMQVGSFSSAVDVYVQNFATVSH